MSAQLEQQQAPPNATEMMRIAVGLTLTCLAAAIVLGFFFYLTEPAKVRNIQAREQAMIQTLLALTPAARIHEVRRYLHWKGQTLEVLYLTPRALVRVDEAGNPLDTREVPAEVAAEKSPDHKDAWVRQSAGAGENANFNYAGRFFIGEQDGAVAGYVVEGSTPGYKTWIRYFIAIDARFGVQGLEVIEHEEDPGLGAEITQRYFKNQYAGRRFEQIDAIEVIKDPLPNDWRKRLEQLGDMDLDSWVRENRAEIDAHPQIHAITGSTISSVAVTNGVKRSLRNFRKRMRIVEAYL